MLRVQVISVLLFIFLCKFCISYKILIVFPIPGKSHAILGEAFVKTLLKAGHEVTYITPIMMQDLPKLRQIDVSSNFDVMPEDLLNINKLLSQEIDLFEMSGVFEMMIAIANSTLMNHNVQNFLHNPKEEYDVVIIEWMYTELYSGFASVFNCPSIWSSSMDPHYLVLSLIDEDVNPSYTADVYTSYIPPYTITQRILKLWSYLTTRYKKWLTRSLEKDIFEKAYSSALKRRGRSLPLYEDLIYNGSLMFGNSHVSTGQSLRLPQNYIPIGGYHIDADIPPLPKDLQRIMDKAKHGVIYFSIGSMLKSKHISNDIKMGILDVFAGLQQTVIWKFEERLQNLPSNVHIVHWAPQQSILAHPNCKLFITHGGLLSTTETLHFGVPIIGIPVFADQFNNVNRAVAKGFGKRVDLSPHTPAKLKEAIAGILDNPSYQERVKELSFVYHHRPVSPQEEIVHWVEHVVRTGGAMHLRSPALHIPFFQKMYLDLISLILSVLVLTFFVFKFLCYSKIPSTSGKIKYQ